MNVIFLQPNYYESSHLVDRGQNPLKLLYSIMILNTISLPYKATPTKHPEKGEMKNKSNHMPTWHRKLRHGYTSIEKIMMNN
jgi:hypothetical protein